MSKMLIIFAVIAFTCVIANTISRKHGMPALLLFMCLGMLFGSDGIFKIPFEDYNSLQQISTVALIFIIFYGGFSTKWQTAKPVIKEATLLSTIGVLLTALLTCGFCYYVLHLNFAESFLIGATISSTDAASVFSILRFNKLNLKYSTAPMLELESGSNDPFSYMLTVIGIAIYLGSGLSAVPVLFLQQILFGIGIGVGCALLSVFLLKKTSLINSAGLTIFLMASALFSFAFADVFNGNGLLSVYIFGIILGNAKIKDTKILVNFFDNITFMAQVLIFFMLGLTAFPRNIPDVFLVGTLIFLFITFIARPISVFAILLPFKAKLNQCILVSWAGLRGAASIVFAALVVAGVTLPEKYDLFHVIFLIALLSVSIQGTLLPYVSRKLDMIDDKSDVTKTFNDYQEELAFSLIEVNIDKNHIWKNKLIKDIRFPESTLAIAIKRGDKNLVPNGNTEIHEGDRLIVNSPVYNSKTGELEEIYIHEKHKWKDKKISEINLGEGKLIVMISRKGKTIIPKGGTTIKEGDTLVVYG